MVNGNDLVEYEEDNIEMLFETFILKYEDEWNAHIEDCYTNTMASMQEDAFDMAREDNERC